MSKVNFKVGDLVYCPYISSQIMTIKELPSDIIVTDITQSTNRNDYGIVKDVLWQKVIYLKDGRCMKTHLQAVCHATQENYERLSATFPNIEFEQPPRRKEPKEVIKAMLASGATLIPCLVVDYDDNRILDYKKATRHSSSVLIYGISENGRFLSTNPHCSSYKYAVPFDIETGKVILDFVNGEMILENGNETINH